MLRAPLGIFGGTFDPIHSGHIYPTIQAAKLTQIEKIAMIPCYIPTHKSSASVTSQHRLNMIELVCQQHDIFYADARDINRGVPTYSVDTLNELRAERPNTPLCFFIGTDSLVNLFTWHKWQEILSLCHFVVCHRHNDEPTTVAQDSALQAILAKHQTSQYLDLHTKLAGHIFIADTERLTVSSSQLREQLKMNTKVEKFIPSNVLNYIHQHKLYQPSDDLC
ncbi:nicotinate-nucleotide adenylyltransferase [Paraglaciecola aquimarina]|uniref:Probable nicotinate-nucleotide adenylyltransferase n=1 Tax=Paraglaciecola aquimarina TaxID=1235557 RepID=A0ABU3SZN7_9ALTE|nr:nicotinate-nucleotide adenylyltransferase [Paraglaciecola aquimarina]MDU0355461.1 nicotinate-nucleotide adenylyltransferase [Paraglaciecola aquimarina]